jgi:hypothetical protein
MVYLYLCKACEEGRHGACEIGHPCPPGQYGGDKCRCPCGGQADWNTPERIEKDLRKLVESIMDHQKASEEILRINKLAKITRPPEKS